MLLAKLIFVALVVYMTESNPISPNISKRWLELIEPYRKECILESEVLEEDRYALLNNSTVVEVNEMGCFIKCVYERLGLFETNGTINTQAFTDTFFYMTPELTERCMQEVADVKGPCRRAFVFGNCIVEAVKDYAGIAGN